MQQMTACTRQKWLLKGYRKVFCKFEKSIVNCGSSRPEVLLRKGVLKICSKFTEEHACRSVKILFAEPKNSVAMRSVEVTFMTSPDQIDEKIFLKY